MKDMSIKESADECKYYGEDKSIIVTAILWFFFGYFAIHRFYLGQISHAIFMLVSFVGLCGVLPSLILSAGNTGAEAGFSMIFSIFVCAAWYFIDGIYVILKMERALKHH